MHALVLLAVLVWARLPKLHPAFATRWTQTQLAPFGLTRRRLFGVVKHAAMAWRRSKLTSSGNRSADQRERNTERCLAASVRVALSGTRGVSRTYSQTTIHSNNNSFKITIRAKKKSSPKSSPIKLISDQTNHNICVRAPGQTA